MVAIPNYDHIGKGRKKDNDEKKVREYKVLHPFYTQISRTLICGASGTGKTNLLLHILLSPMIYYESIILWTRTPDQPKYIELKQIFDDIAKKAKIPSFFTIKSDGVIDPDTVDDKTFKLWIFDDFILEKKEFEKITKAFVLGRHKKISNIFLSQSYFLTPKTIRLNCSHFHLFHVGGRREINAVLADHPGISKEQFLKNTANFGFISINKFSKKVFHNLDENMLE